MKIKLFITASLLTSVAITASAYTAEKEAKAEHLNNYLYNNVYTSAISHVKVTESTITITGHCDGAFSLVEATPDVDVTECKAFAHRTDIGDKDFCITLNRYASYDGFNYDRLLSRWAIVAPCESGDSLMSYARYADEVPAISSPDELVPANKKGVGAGLGETYMNDLVDLGATNITCNWVITGMIAQSAIWGNSIPYSYGGKQYYIDGGQIASWDHMLSFYEQHGIAVSAILLVTPSSSDASLSDVFRHPEYTSGYYSMPNMTCMESINAYAAILSYLASRYNGSGHGRIEHWIMHNEVDMGDTWTNMGSQPELVYNDEYMKSMRLCYNIVRQYDQNAAVLGSYTHSWNYGPNGYATKAMLEQTVRYSEVEGDFWWGVAHHPYPQNLTKPDFWNDDTQSTNLTNSPYVTFKNLEVINEWMLQDEHKYHGEKKRKLFLSENGTNSPSYSESDLAHQAAGGAWAWKKTNALEGIDAIMWHNWMDNRVEFGLRIGLHFYPDDETNPGGNKPVWYVWQAAGTDREDEVLNPYKDIIGVEDWRDIFMLAQGTGRNLSSGKCFIIEAEDYDKGGYSARQTSAGDYRADSEGVCFGEGTSYSNGWGLFNMGAPWNEYSLNKWTDASTKAISREMAQENWGSWYEYSFSNEDPLEVNIYVHHGAAWNQWGMAAGAGYAPGTDSYQIQGEPSLNWPKQYAGAMVLALDGNNLATTQTARPIAPEAYQARGTNFNKVLTKPENWTSTLTNGALQTDTLWLWPVAGGNNTASAYYNDKPDYKSLHIAPGTHTLRLTSICSPWNFDCLKIDCFEPSAINDVTTNRQADDTLRAWATAGIIHITSNKPVTIYTLTGQRIATLPSGTHTHAAPPGLYLVTTGHTTQKLHLQ